MTNNKENISNGLMVGIDWLSFTVHSDYSPNELIEFMGFDPELFRTMPNGANGYKRMRKHENISILYDGSENMGIHVNITGASIATLLESYKETLSVNTPFGKAYELWEETALSKFLTEVLKIGHITRIDLAIDDHGVNFYTTDEIIEKLKNGQIVSKWRTSQNNEENVIANNEKVGHTVYFGSTQSDIRMRIYDKQLERNKGLSVTDERYHNEKWVRWELQLRKERAESIAKLLANKIPLGQVSIGVLANYFRIINLDDRNKSRCTLEDKWECFVNDVRKLKITLKKEPKTLEEEIEQFVHQNGRKIAKIVVYNGGDLSYFGDIACRYESRLTQEDRQQLGIV